MAQSTTMTGNPYAECMTSVGEWAQTYPFLTQQQRATAVNAYNEFYGIYLLTRSGSSVARQPQQPVGQQPARQRQRAATGQRRRAATTTTRARGRVRTVPGQLGQVDAKVLTQIVANANINTEALRKRPSLRSMTANIVGTCISRLLKTGMITGTAKVGPFSATPQGIQAVQKQPTSIGQARQARQQRRRPATTTTTEQTAATA